MYLPKEMQRHYYSGINDPRGRRILQQWKMWRNYCLLVTCTLLTVAVFVTLRNADPEDIDAVKDHVKKRFVDSPERYMLPPGEQHEEISVKMLDWSWIDMDCTMQLIPDQVKIQLTLQEQQMSLTSAGIVSADGRLIGETLKDPVVCRSKDVVPTGRLAIFTQAAKASDLTSEDQWKSFRNQYLYAEKHGHVMYLLVGAAEGKPAIAQRSADAADCDEAEPPRDHLRAVTSALILQRTPSIAALLHMDLDTWFPYDTYNMDIADLTLAYEEDFVVGMPSREASMDPAIFLVKNTLWARNFLWKWFKNRCGSRVETSLWNTLFIELKKVRLEFEWDQTAMKKYSTAVDYNWEIVEELFPDLKCELPLRAAPFCQRVVRLPHVAILPRSGPLAFRYQSDQPATWNLWRTPKSPRVCQCKSDDDDCGAGCSMDEKA